MADQDFVINIRATANTGAIQLTQQQLTELQKAAAEGNKEAIKALNQIEKAQKAVAREQAQAEREMASGIRAAAGYGLVIGGIVGKAINDFAEAQNRVTKELSEQGDLLVKNALAWNKLSQSAVTLEDVGDLGAKATAQVDALTKKFNEANQETLTLGQRVQDLIQKFATWTPFQPGSNQALLDEKLKGLQQFIAEEQQNAARNVKRGLDEERNIRLDIDSVIERETQHLRDQEALLERIDPKENLQSWVAVEKTIERIKKKLEDLNTIVKEGNKPIEDKKKEVEKANEKAEALAQKAETLKGKPEGEEAALEAEKARADAQRQDAELREQQRAAARKKSDFAEVSKYGRVLDPSERVSETIKEGQELFQKLMQAQSTEFQKRLSDQMEAQLKGITPEQLKNEREAKGIKGPDQKDTSQGIIDAIRKLSEKFDRYWQ